MANPSGITIDDFRRIANAPVLWRYACYVPLLVPIILFISSLYIPPGVGPDSAMGFFALRHMLGGGAFNTITAPDPVNIANDVQAFLTWWSPGQYLVPGTFVWLGTDLGLALSLTVLFGTLIGVVGWIQLARSFAVSPFVLYVFVFGLSTFAYITLPFLVYTGGELLLFAAAPWSLYAMRWAADKRPVVCLAISLLSAGILFLAKLTGLIVFATNVVAISLLALVRQRRLSSSIIAMWAASAIGAFCFSMFWTSRGGVPADGTIFSFSWLVVMCTTLSGVAFSGVSGPYFLSWFLGHPWVGITSASNRDLISYVLAAPGLLLVLWVWLRLRHTLYRGMAALLLAIIILYAIVLATLLLRGGAISLEERHFRYAGILFFLLLLTAVDQWRVSLSKAVAWVMVIVLAFFGLKNSVTGAYRQIRTGYYDPLTGISQDVVSPAILEYLRSDAAQHKFRRAITVVPTPSTAISLPQFHIIDIPLYRAMYINGQAIDADRLAGRAEKLFVIVPHEMLLNGKAEVILRSFIDYDFNKWGQVKLDGTVIYTQ